METNPYQAPRPLGIEPTIAASLTTSSWWRIGALLVGVLAILAVIALVDQLIVEYIRFTTPPPTFEHVMSRP